MYTLTLKTPVGYLEISSNEISVTAIRFVDEYISRNNVCPEILRIAQKQLTEYFNGIRKVFDLPISLQGTEFQKNVWSEVLKINFGETASYLEIAKATGSEKNSRAVGLANGKNPIPIIIPCHRIIGTNGKLTGYAGGIERKRWLLKHELDHSKKTNLLF